ncbi:hypothetical protein B0I35DRAFT_414891 [Stachybotrys elegans]|uniref:Uncharacterized protein n=1 Tax=Stachybotrys elegans TaxID=80388 RepID=A0A8K0SCE6_9HYPO|nr:hypothetical protein B0I35DRAFT_414891 [Stachybotrys elegans]
MPSIDAAFGASQNTVNALLPQLFQALRPTNLFKFNVNIDQVGFKSVDVDITQSPSVNFTPTGIPTHVSETVLNVVSSSPEFQQLAETERNAVASGALAALSNINFDIIIEGIKLQLNYSDTTKKPLVLTAKIVLTTLVSIDASIASTIRLQAESGVITTSMPDLDNVLNSAIVPYVRTTINNASTSAPSDSLSNYPTQDILSPIAIPILQFLGIIVSVPVAQIVNDYVLAYTALGVAPPDLPTGSVNWPSDGVFVSVGTPLISTIANQQISNAASQLPHTGFNEGPFTGDLGVSLDNLQNVDILDDGSISAAISAQAAANVTFHTLWPLPNFSFGPISRGTIGLQAKTSVSDSQLIISDISVNKFNLSFEWGVIPGWVNAILRPLLDPLQDYLFKTLIRPQISAVLAPLDIPVYTIPTITIPVNDSNFTISLPSISKIWDDVCAGDHQLVQCLS